MKQMTLPFHLTLAARQVLAAVEQSAAARSVAIVAGPSGCGKSAFAAWLAGSPMGARVLVCEPAVPNSPRSVGNSLLEALRLPPAPTALTAFTRLIHQLEHSSVQAVVVDDAHRLAAHSLELLRCLHERAGIGLVLIGPGRLCGRLKMACPELGGRLEQVQVMGPIRPHDVFVMLFARKVPTSRRSLWRLVETSRALVVESGGNVRRLLGLLRQARAIARQRHRALCPAFVARAAAERPIPA